jgi:hypothetical protein
MITREREKTSGRRPPPPSPPSSGRPREPWWRNWPSPANRPRPLNRRSFLLGSAVLLPALVLIDGLLGLMAGYATGRVEVGVAVGVVMLVLTTVEFAIVAWAARKRQEIEARRAE